MALRIIPFAESTGALRDTYERLRERTTPAVYRPAHGGIAGIIEAHSLDPTLMTLVLATSSTLNGAGPLSWVEREIVNTTASRLDQCVY